MWIGWWVMFCIRYAIYIQKYETVADNPPIKIYVNKIENRIIFKIKTGYYIEFLTSKTMKLLGSNKSKITKDKKWYTCASFRNY